jgi:predicted RNA-binding protein with PUA-like domain
MAKKKQYWLMKSEPDAYSIDDLKRDGQEPWDGIRNYQARNFLRDVMQIGDRALFYHSNANPPGVVGIMECVSGPEPDALAFTPGNPYFDEKSDPENPTWIQRQMKFVSKFPRMVTLNELKDDPELEGMFVTRKGQRLSIQPVEKEHYDHVLKLAKRKPVS